MYIHTHISFMADPESGKPRRRRIEGDNQSSYANADRRKRAIMCMAVRIAHVWPCYLKMFLNLYPYRWVFQTVKHQ